MKYIARIFLFLFVAFLSTPTLICLIKKNTNTSAFYNFNEEEIHKDLKEIKANLKDDYNFVFVTAPIILNSKIISENLSKHDNIAEEIFSQPPEFI
ncbi:hypothetical protein OX283_003410 [Flavobacterium sp. SUN052]|uniref:hypothetical protein n=1 Tax=Flavobacterium sp. SUN052 TaxID=3002441 RepID=UPI00237D8201|nr:hypothetical protein [Flavobacterium sp. SUN052]MEC4003690.1 hypothetical protein [Flavobacterium sp. SUN052]